MQAKSRKPAISAAVVAQLELLAASARHVGYRVTLYTDGGLQMPDPYNSGGFSTASADESKRLLRNLRRNGPSRAVLLESKP